MSETTPHTKVRTGTVRDDARHKTVIVRVERRTRHPKYGKMITCRKHYHVHDERNEAKRGDLVSIAECRPISKTKRWRLERIVKRPTFVAAREEIIA